MLERASAAEAGGPAAAAEKHRILQVLQQLTVICYPPLVYRALRAGSFPPKDVTAEQVMFHQLQFATGESRLLR